MKKIILCLMLPLALFGSELVFQFKSPTFTGVGYSAHKLTLEQISFNRKKAIEDGNKAIQNADQIADSMEEVTKQDAEK